MAAQLISEDIRREYALSRNATTAILVHFWQENAGQRLIEPVLSANNRRGGSTKRGTHMPALQAVHCKYNYEQTREFLLSKNLWLDVETAMDARMFRGNVQCVHEPRLHHSRTSYGAAVELRAEEGATGHIVTLSSDGEIVDLSGHEARPLSSMVYSPSRRLHIKIPSAVSRQSITIDSAELARHFARMTGEPLVGDIVFDAGINLTHGVEGILRSMCNLLTETANNGPLGVHVTPLEEALFSTLLFCQPHNHLNIVLRRPALAGSGDVKRVLDYVDANLAEPLTLADLIAVANVPGRTLNEHFRKFTGLAPMAYVRRERLKKARQMLAASLTESVTEAALACGFFHLGRFAAEYRHIFGETPLETLKFHRTPSLQTAARSRCRHD
jgi:AraC-like DNA-binding protein